MHELKYNKGYTNGDWRSWYDMGNGALGDWGAHIFDTAHEFLQMGLPTEVEAVKAEGHSDFIFPQATTLAFRFPARGTQPPVELTWYDGVKNLPPLPADFGGNIVDPNGVFGTSTTVNLLVDGAPVFSAVNTDGTGQSSLAWRHFTFSGVGTSNSTTASSPASRPTRAYPINWATGRVTEAYTSRAYSCTTSVPAREPSLRTRTDTRNAS
jgi:hypothetical protein